MFLFIRKNEIQAQKTDNGTWSFCQAAGWRGAVWSCGGRPSLCGGDQKSTIMVCSVWNVPNAPNINLVLPLARFILVRSSWRRLVPTDVLWWTRGRLNSRTAIIELWKMQRPREAAQRETLPQCGDYASQTLWIKLAAVVCASVSIMWFFEHFVYSNSNYTIPLF